MKVLKYSILLLFFFIIAFGAYLFLDQTSISRPTDEPFQIYVENEVNWDSVNIELTTILTDLIQIKTVRKNESQAAFYLQNILEKEGIQTKVIPHPDFPDKVSLVAEIGPENSEEGIILLNHLDVVEVTEEEWDVSPFGGEMKDNIIHGRGTLDMKGMATMELMAFILLHRMNTQLAHKVMFLAVPDEESGGTFGANYLLTHHEDLFTGYRYVINEGGFGIKDFPKQGNQIFNIQTSEKGILGVELTAKGLPGHGSMPPKDYSSLNMTKFLNELPKLSKFSLTPQTLEFFNTLAHFYEFPENFLLSRIQNPLIQKIITSKLTENRTINAMVTNTISVTNLQTNSSGPNVLPSETKAYLDIRILPNTTPEAVFQEIQSLAQEYNIETQIKVSYPPSESSPNTDFYNVLYTIIQDNVKDSKITQYLSPGATDNRFFRAKGFECYGITPILITMEDIATLHGKNESISLQNLQLGTKILLETLVGYNQMGLQQ